MNILKGAHLVKVCFHFVLLGARFVDFKIPNEFFLEAGRQLIINGRDLLVVGCRLLQFRPQGYIQHVVMICCN